MFYKELVKHQNFPFLNFENNDLEFLLLEKFWVEFLRKCLFDFGYNEAWYPVLPAGREGNPIVFVASDEADMAIRVILRVNEECLPYPEWALPEEFWENAESYSDEFFDEQLKSIEAYFAPILWTVERLRDLNRDTSFRGITVVAEMSEKALRYTAMIIRLFLAEDYANFSRKMREISDKEAALICGKTYNGINVPEDFSDILCGTDSAGCIDDWVQWIDSMFEGANWP